MSIIDMNLAMFFKWDGQWKNFSAILDRKKNDQFYTGRQNQLFNHQTFLFF